MRVFLSRLVLLGKRLSVIGFIKTENTDWNLLYFRFYSGAVFTVQQQIFYEELLYRKYSSNLSPKNPLKELGGVGLRPGDNSQSY